MLEWIDTIDDELLVRRQQDFRGGANEFIDAASLPDQGVRRLQDMLVEDNGRAVLRPGADALGGSALAAARIEALTYFDTPALELVFASISASLRKWDGANWTNIAGYPFGASSIVEMAQGNNLLYVSTGANAWFTYDGAAWNGPLGGTGSDPPIGATIMCWHTDRMFATGTIASLYDQIYVSTIGDAGTGKWNSSTFAFRVGHGEGQAITALCSAKTWWLAVGKEASLFMVYANPQALTAADWPIARLSDKVGVVGKRCLVSFGDFMVFLSRDGVRKIQTAGEEDNPWEISPPISEPMQPYIERINWTSANKAVMHKYRHFLFVALPLDAATDPSHVLVWNSRLGTWVGVWTGWTPTAFATSLFGGGHRLLIGDTTGKVNQWKDYADTGLDSTYTENSAAMSCRFRGKAWNYDVPMNWKDASFAEAIFEDTSATVDMVAYLDGIEQRRQTFVLEKVTNQLPVDLPFDLAVANPDPVTMALDELPEFREIDIGIEGNAKKVKVKSVSVAAFMNTMKTE